MIESFRVQNFKALRDVTLNLTPIHLLIGPNDSGKTSLLEAMAALCRTVDFPLKEAFGCRWSGCDLVHTRSAHHRVSLSATIAGWIREYSLEVEFPPIGDSVSLKNEIVQYDDARFSLRKNYLSPRNATYVHKTLSGNADAADVMDGEYITSAKTNHEDMIEHDVAGELKGVQLFRWNPRMLSLPCALDSRAGFQMQSSGFGLVRVLDAIISDSPRRFVEELLVDYRRMFPRVADINLRPQLGYRSEPSGDELAPILELQDGKGLFFRFEGDERPVPVANVSDGMLLMLAHLTIVYSPVPVRLLLIEEPENGIHPERLKQVIGFLRELVVDQSHMQVILTSHSPYIVSLFKPEEVTLCRKTAEGHVEVRRLSESRLVREQSDIFSLGEIWPAEEEAIFAESSDQSTVTETQP